MADAAKRIRHQTDYRRHRSGAYPSHGEALDAIAKGFRAVIEAGIPIPAETVEWVEACEAVKRQYPKARKADTSKE